LFNRSSLFSLRAAFIELTSKNVEQEKT